MTTPKPALPEPDLLVECAQGFVRGWTELKVRAAIAAAVADARAEIANLKTVMIAAAEEIAAHWDAHCDAEGYGPQNLMRRLEEGIPSEYGYTAGAFAELKAKAEARAVPEGWKLLKDTTHAERSWPEDSSHENGNYSNTCVHCLRGFVGHKRRPSCKMCAATPSPAEQPKPAVLCIADDDGYVDPGAEVTVTLPPADVLALQTLSGAWEHAMSFLRVDYGRDRTKDHRDSVDGWVDEFRGAVQRLAWLSDRIDAARAALQGEPHD